MSWRYQLPVSSQVSLPTLIRALPHVFTRDDTARNVLARRLEQDLSARHAMLTQCGTAALVVAIRQTVAPEGTLALPAYGCADLVSAAIRARVRVRLYDLDPVSLSPDMDSVAKTLSRGVDAIVVTHLFGVAADVASVRTLAAQRGVGVVEDAAQGLGSTLQGEPGGSLADRSVLSFGRGKGVSGGAGGALLLRGDAKLAVDQDAVTDARNGALLEGSSGWRPLVMTAAQLVVGHPALYRIPASLPFLHLGEMVYKDAPEPTAIPSPCAVSALESWISLPARVRAQRAIADRYAATVPSERAVRPLPDSHPSSLRYPVRVSDGADVPKELGVLRGYPATLSEQRHVGAVICDNEPDMPGARVLRQELVTLPTHEQMTPTDVERVRRWLESVQHA